MRTSLLVLILLPLFVLLSGCESNDKKDLSGELEKRQTTVPDLLRRNKPQQQFQLTPLTNLTPEQEKIKEEAIAVIRKNLEATQNEDVEGVLATIHEDSPQLQSTKRGMEYIFKNFDMKYELLEAEVISITNDEVRVFYRQRTEAVKGTGFTNQDAAGIHILRKSKDGHWKIYKTEYL